VGKDCPKCKKSLYDFEDTHPDLFKLLNSNEEPKPDIPDENMKTVVVLPHTEPIKPI